MQTNAPSRRDPEWDAYKVTIVETANKVGADMAGCGIDAFRLLVAAHDVVWGVWQDRGEPDGIGMMMIKGAQIVREIIAEGRNRSVVLTAIPCRCIEEAEALRLTIGEADRRH